MIGLVLVTHGRLAAEFVTALEHVVGKQERIEPICIGPDDDMEGRRNDIAEAIGDSKEAIAHYSTALSVPERIPVPVVRVTMYSADRDLTAAGLRELDGLYEAVTVDWESGAIAWVLIQPDRI